MTYRQIATHLGVHPNAAHFAVTQALARSAAASLSLDDRERERTLELLRLDEMTVCAWAILSNEMTPSAVALKAIDVLMKFMERRARLLRLDVVVRRIGS